MPELLSAEGILKKWSCTEACCCAPSCDRAPLEETVRYEAAGAVDLGGDPVLERNLPDACIDAPGDAAGNGGCTRMEPRSGETGEERRTLEEVDMLKADPCNGPASMGEGGPVTAREIRVSESGIIRTASVVGHLLHPRRGARVTWSVT